MRFRFNPEKHCFDWTDEEWAQHREWKDTWMGTYLVPMAAMGLASIWFPHAVFAMIGYNVLFVLAMLVLS